MPNCEHCKKRKLGIISYSCKCEYKELCSKCRLPEQHDCTYDHRMEERKKLEKANPIVVGEKLERI